MTADTLKDLAGAVGAAAGGAVTGGATSVMEVLASLFKLAASPGGQEALARLLPTKAAIEAEQAKLDAAIALEHHVMPKEGTP